MPRFQDTVYTDTMHGHFKSPDGNPYAQVFATEDFFAAAYPMEAKSMAGDALIEFKTDYGVPDKVMMEGAAEQTGRKTTFMQQVRKRHIDFHLIVGAVQSITDGRGYTRNQEEMVFGS